MLLNQIRRDKYSLYIIILFSILLSVRLLKFIDATAVNLLFSDHWTYLKPMFENGNAWDRFTYQHGPHRQGLGFVISGWLMQASNWDTRVDSYFIGIVLCVTNALLLYLLKKYRGKIILNDLICPILVLSPIHYETILLATNSSHSVVPLFLLVLSCFAFFMANELLSAIYILVCGFLLVFTGFGLFAGLLILLFLALKSLYLSIHTQDKILHLILFGLSCAPPLYYFCTYNFQFATYDFSLKPPTTFQYLEFICYLWSGLFQIRPPYAFGAGAIILLCLFASLAMLHKEFYQTKDKKYLIPFYFIVSSLLYSIAVSTGRIETGANFAQGSRYMTLPMLGIFGLYLSIQAIKIKWIKTTSMFILFLLSINDINLDKTHYEVLNGFQDIKRKFLAEYSSGKSLEQVQADSGVIIPGATQERFQQLQERGLHFKNEEPNK